MINSALSERKRWIGEDGSKDSEYDGRGTFSKTTAMVPKDRHKRMDKYRYKLLDVMR